MNINDLTEDILQCTDCILCATRKNIVVIRGTPTPDILLIGEAPGAEEDEQGLPFVGRSGQLLDRALQSNGINNFAIINIIKCRPPGNRKPTQAEVKACSHWLEAQLLLLQPKIIVLLGATALNYFFPEKRITKSVQDTLYSSKAFEKDGMKFVAVFHPSYVLRGAVSVDEYIRSFGSIINIMDGI